MPDDIHVGVSHFVLAGLLYAGRGHHNLPARQIQGAVPALRVERQFSLEMFTAQQAARRHIDNQPR